jgi:hypothetical protein
MVEGVIASLIAAALIWLATYCYRNWFVIGAFPRCILWQRQRRVRISVAVLLRVVTDGRFILARLPRRPEAFGPLGGVVKFHPQALPALGEIGFEPQLPPAPGDARAQDLRGFLPARELLTFVRWLSAKRDRENSMDCLRRELAEECHELGLPVSNEDLGSLQFTFQWRVREGPRSLGPVFDYLQFRSLEVFDLNGNSAANRRFITVLREAAAAGGGDPIAEVTVGEIRSGRMVANPRALIAHHSCYLFTRRRLREELPPF